MPKEIIYFVPGSSGEARGMRKRTGRSSSKTFCLNTNSNRLEKLNGKNAVIITGSFFREENIKKAVELLDKHQATIINRNQLSC
jgi:hypothetical protein